MDKKNGHWYTDKNGNHYFVEEGQTPKEGWEASKRRKMIDGGEYKLDDGDGKGPRSVTREEYDKYEADEVSFDETNDDDFGFDEEDYQTSDYRASQIVAGVEDELGVRVSDYESFKQVADALIDRGYADDFESASDMIRANLDDALWDRINTEHMNEVNGMDDENRVTTPENVLEKLKEMKSEDSDLTDEELNDLANLISETLGNEEIDMGAPYESLDEVDFDSLIEYSENEIHDLGRRLLGQDFEYDPDQGEDPRFEAEDNTENEEPDFYLSRDPYHDSTSEFKRQLKKLKGLDKKLKLEDIKEVGFLENPENYGYDSGYEILTKDGRTILTGYHFFGEDQDLHVIEEPDGGASVPFRTAYGYESDDIGNMRTFPNRTGSPMTKDNRWIGTHYSIDEAHSGNPQGDEANFSKRFRPVGKTKLGSDIFQGPDGYYSLNPRVYGESFKTIEDLEDYYENEGSVRGQHRELSDRYDAYKKRKGIVNNKIEEQVNDGVTEDDIGYLRQVLQDIPGFNSLPDNQIRKIISSIRNRK